jgi:hypothetical protein
MATYGTLFLQADGLAVNSRAVERGFASDTPGRGELICDYVSSRSAA